MTAKRYSSLAAYLKATKQTQEQFAEALSARWGRRVSQGNVSLYVSGQQMPRPKLAILISEMTGVSMDSMAKAAADYAANKSDAEALV